jgi:hypothetical protein
MTRRLAAYPLSKNAGVTYITRTSDYFPADFRRILLALKTEDNEPDGPNLTTSDDMVICDVESAGSVSTPLGELVRSRVVQEDCAPDHALAVFVAELFAILHPAVLPMLERMFEDVRLDAENDGELGLKWRAEIGLLAARIALQEQEAVEG